MTKQTKTANTQHDNNQQIYICEINYQVCLFEWSFKKCLTFAQTNTRAIAQATKQSIINQTTVQNIDQKIISLI